MKREEREGRAAMPVRDFACSDVPFWMFLVSGDASILSLQLLQVQHDTVLPLGGGQMLLPAAFLLNKEIKKKKPPPPSSPHLSMQNERTNRSVA